MSMNVNIRKVLHLHLQLQVQLCAGDRSMYLVQTCVGSSFKCFKICWSPKLFVLSNPLHPCFQAHMPIIYNWTGGGSVAGSTVAHCWSSVLVFLLLFLIFAASLPLFAMLSSSCDIFVLGPTWQRECKRAVWQHVQNSQLTSESQRKKSSQRQLRPTWQRRV